MRGAESGGKCVLVCVDHRRAAGQNAALEYGDERVHLAAGRRAVALIDGRGFSFHR
jgi:hypothetical protein